MHNQATQESIRRAPRLRAAGRRRALSALAPSEHASRYQAQIMPRPTYDLDRKDESTSLLAICLLSLAVVATGAAIVLIQRLGAWLAS